MMNSMEHMPSHIFDWIESKPFDSLTKSQQQEVEACMSKEDYERFYHAASAIRALDQDQPEPSPIIKQNLLSAFDRKYTHGKPAKSILLYTVPLWKVAALFVLLGGGSLWILLETKFRSEVTYITIKDTVYVPSYTANDETIKVKDTIYLPEESSGKKTAKKTVLRHRISVVGEEKTETTAAKVATLPGIHSSPKDKEALPNKTKGKNVKDDSLLLQQPGFNGL